MPDYTLEQVANALRVHPRTVLRRITGHPNPYWAPGVERRITVPAASVAMHYDLQPRLLASLVAGKEDLMTQEEAAKSLGIPIRTFVHRRYPAVVREGKVVRYLRSATFAHHVDRYL